MIHRLPFSDVWCTMFLLQPKRKSIDQEVELAPAKKSRSDEPDASLSTETSAVPSASAVADGDSVKCTYCQSSTNRHGNTEDLLVCKDCHANS